MPLAGVGKELNFEAAIEQGLIDQGWEKRINADYDRDLCLDPEKVINFIIATQPEEWEKLKAQHGDDVRDRFLKRLSGEIAKRGVLKVLRDEFKDTGARFRLAYFKPSSGLNEEIQRLYGANSFTVMRQVHYSEANENSLDMVLFLNGIPIFTVELKSKLNGQTVEDAIWQYRKDRDPKEPLFHLGRCLAHFAVDNDLAYMTTKLEGTKTFFLPFNRGFHGGAGNPPLVDDHATAYLWKDVWTRDSVLHLIDRFCADFMETQEDGKRKRKVIFPRYHQRDAVQSLVTDTRAGGPGQRYLIQHSAGSGKSNTIAWLALQLSTLHDDDDRRVFDSIIVITDRRILDRQLQTTLGNFITTKGVLENIDKTSRQLKEALEGIVTLTGVSADIRFDFFQVAALAFSHTLNASVRNLLNVGLLSK